jgi:trans-aconitate 2-methyltransferase
MSDAWEPAQYERFATSRSAPFHDLAGLVESPPAGARVADLGCGTGSLTATLVARWHPSQVIGVDTSDRMLADAAAHATDVVTFAKGDIGGLDPELAGFDVIVANASLHWLPDHARVLADWVGRLRAGGQLAVQVPANADHPAQTVATEVAQEAVFLAAFEAGPPPDPVGANVLAPEVYASLLDRLGCARQHVRLQVYGMHLDGVDALVEWVKGTTLTRFRAQLAPDVYDAFVARYRERLGDVLGEPARYFYPFKRILFWGRLAGA